MRIVGILAVVIVSTGSAAAEPIADRLWPSVPEGHALSLQDQITDRLTALGNELGHHLDLLSDDMFALTVDGRHRCGHVRLGGGDAQYLMFRIDSDVKFDDATARIQTRLALGVAGHAMKLELPAFDMAPTSVNGDRGVELRLPLIDRSW